MPTGRGFRGSRVCGTRISQITSSTGRGFSLSTSLRDADFADHSSGAEHDPVFSGLSGRRFLEVTRACDPSLRPNSSKACADCLSRDADHADHSDPGAAAAWRSRARAFGAAAVPFHDLDYLEDPARSASRERDPRDPRPVGDPRDQRSRRVNTGVSINIHVPGSRVTSAGSESTGNAKRPLRSVSSSRSTLGAPAPGIEMPTSSGSR